LGVVAITVVVVLFCITRRVTGALAELFGVSRGYCLLYNCAGVGKVNTGVNQLYRPMIASVTKPFRSIAKANQIQELFHSSSSFLEFSFRRRHFEKKKILKAGTRVQSSDLGGII
jgi:hypothetical protein